MNDFFNVLDDFALEDFVADGESGSSSFLVPDTAGDSSGERAADTEEYINNVEYDKVDAIRGMDVVICTTAKTDEEAKELLTLVGAPFYS